ncbi:MAG: hypothetical protein AVDCRST_MAG65-190 [uncultured Solirubrobacteraceae bacterium]|uniref:Uncharacterized protein n=1 Tax=uncultured Solirubrobacteraceae bacterium TaxID=1162706 RepID=A0A6J4R9C3_9ACTN|nr:MAG: hypothetical protein AVDCRST_MAG65-190 [uncultured Solirubrobacteraceae bacterium]
MRRPRREFVSYVNRCFIPSLVVCFLLFRSSGWAVGHSPTDSASSACGTERGPIAFMRCGAHPRPGRATSKEHQA